MAENSSNDQQNDQDTIPSDDDVEQLKLKLMAQQQLLEKKDGIISSLRKTEKRAQRSDGIIRDALGALRQGVNEQFLGTIKELPVETQWDLLKAYPRYVEGEASDKGKEDDERREDKTDVDRPVTPIITARPKAEPIVGGAYEREKAELVKAGQANMHTVLSLIRKHRK
jgi:hypothetical protein